MRQEIAAVFEGLPQRFCGENVRAERSYCFVMGVDETWTVEVAKDRCAVRKGEKADADVFFEASPQLFLDVWNGRHQLGLADFLTGRVRSNNPLLLKEFVAAFQKP